jgi:Protein-tyrosine phosphatase
MMKLLVGAQAAERNCISFISFPIPDRGVPPSFGDAASLMTRIAAQLDAGKNVAVHCRQGIGRSGMIAAGVLVTSGASPEEAMQTVSSARGAEVPETPSNSVDGRNNYPRGSRSQRVDVCAQSHQNKL